MNTKILELQNKLRLIESVLGSVNSDLEKIIKEAYPEVEE